MDIICVATPSWEGNYVKSTVELTKRMAQRHRVLYVDYNYTCKDMIMAMLGGRTAPVKRMTGIRKRLREVQASGSSVLWLLTPPPVFPVNFIRNRKIYTFIQWINASIVRRSILKASKKLQFTCPTVINAWNPAMGNLLYRKLHERMTVYYCYDEINEALWIREHGRDEENRFLQLADATFVTSKGLLETKKPQTKRCFLIQNGVDFDLFRTGYSFPKKHPVVIGYIGTIDSRIDYAILEAIVRDFPEAQLVLAGPVTTGIPEVDDAVIRLKVYPTVTFAGAISSEVLPGLLKNFHAGIIPFVKNAQTAAIYPMKINEYLAAGIPVVTTDFAPLDEFAGCIAVARSVSGFVQAIRTELMSDNASKRQTRQQIAQANSWNNRALTFEENMHDLLASLPGN